MLNCSCFQDIFANLCVVDSDKYFLCDLGVMRELASLIEHVDLTIASRFAVCCAPISLEPFLSSMFVQVRRDGSPLNTLEMLNFKMLCSLRVTLPITRH